MSFDALEPGATIERYVVVEKLGEGAAAQVFRVRHAQLGKDFALKVLSIRRHPDLRKRIIQEGQLQSSVDHPNVVRVFDILDVKDSPALLMELIEGPTLDVWAAEHEPDLDTALEVFTAMVHGVAAAHELGLVHRDLKPGNVLLVSRGGQWQSKIADFGLAKATRGDGGLGLSMTGVALGTPQYMAPEQIRDSKRVDERADVFALGCMLYLLVCGKGPFEHAAMIDTYQAIVSGDYPPPRGLNPELPDRVVEAIDGCLRVDANERIGSCQALLTVLEGRPPSPPPPARPRPWLATAVVVMGIAVLGLGGQIVIGAATLAWWAHLDRASAAVAEGICGGVVGEVVGYAWAGASLDRDAGSVWTLDRDRNVRADHPREDNDWDVGAPVVCILPKGARVTLELAPIEVPRAVWVPVVAGSVESGSL